MFFKKETYQENSQMQLITKAARNEEEQSMGVTNEKVL